MPDNTIVIKVLHVIPDVDGSHMLYIYNQNKD